MSAEKFRTNTVKQRMERGIWLLMVQSIWLPARIRLMPASNECCLTKLSSSAAVVTDSQSTSNMQLEQELARVTGRHDDVVAAPACTRLPTALMMFCALDLSHALKLTRASIKECMINTTRGMTSEPVWFPCPRSPKRQWPMRQSMTP